MAPAFVRLHYTSSQKAIKTIKGLKESLLKQIKEERTYLPDHLEVDEELTVEGILNDIAKLVFMVSMNNKEIVGHLIVSKSSPNLVKGIYVDPNYRRRGYGKVMLERLQESVTGAPIIIGVLENNITAQAFFTKLGYEVNILSYS